MKKGFIILILILSVAVACAVPAFASYKTDISVGSGTVTAQGSNPAGPDVDLVLADQAVRTLVRMFEGTGIFSNPGFGEKSVHSERPLDTYVVDDFIKMMLTSTINTLSAVIPVSAWHAKYNEDLFYGLKSYEIVFYCGSVSKLSDGTKVSDVVKLKLETPLYADFNGWLNGEFEWFYGTAVVVTKTIGGQGYKALTDYSELGKLKEVPLLDENGNQIVDGYGNPRYQLAV